MSLANYLPTHSIVVEIFHSNLTNDHLRKTLGEISKLTKPGQLHPEEHKVCGSFHATLLRTTAVETGTMKTWVKQCDEDV